VSEGTGCVCAHVGSALQASAMHILLCGRLGTYIVCIPLAMQECVPSGR
jgi:hypothetical protein